MHCVALGFIVSGLLLSERPRVRIAPGTPKSPIKSNFFGLLLSTAHRGAEVQGKTAACYAYKLCVARLKLIAAPHKIAQERWVSVVPYCGYNDAYAPLYAVGVDAVAPHYLGAKLGGDAVQKVAVLHRYDYCAYKILVTE